MVDVQDSDSGYQNKIYWSADNWATSHFIGVDNQTASVNIGSFAKGTNIEFGIVNDYGQRFTTGPASANSDNLVHARTNTLSDGVQIGFEDLYGGGDNDFNDAIIAVRNLPPPAPSPPPVRTPTVPGHRGTTVPDWSTARIRATVPEGRIRPTLVPRIRMRQRKVARLPLEMDRAMVARRLSPVKTPTVPSRPGTALPEWKRD